MGVINRHLCSWLAVACSLALVPLSGVQTTSSGKHYSKWNYFCFIPMNLNICPSLHIFHLAADTVTSHRYLTVKKSFALSLFIDFESFFVVVLCYKYANLSE